MMFLNEQSSDDIYLIIDSPANVFVSFFFIFKIRLTAIIISVACPCVPLSGWWIIISEFCVAYRFPLVLSDIVRDQEAYRRGRASIPNMIIMMNPGNGQTYTTEAITDILAEYKLREFHGLDEYLEYKPDGSKASIDWMFSALDVKL